jgi:hypothetical protein
MVEVVDSGEDGRSAEYSTALGYTCID